MKKETLEVIIEDFLSEREIRYRKYILDSLDRIEKKLVSVMLEKKDSDEFKKWDGMLTAVRIIKEVDEKFED